MAKSSAEVARDMLQEKGYLNDGEYKFGEADAHLLRALYMVATSEVVIPLTGYPQLEDIIKQLQDADLRCETPPPWKLNRFLL